ncbi:aminotransferase class I/II-fold pyridoxal phosphate-dependent enzyme [Pedobacter sp. MC2016-24]|uniref:aminotransferase class I/II-fold pyridoxal phosphate-dependent enzyme n=1 Tax=Pedobacter sp. MC2016-24 TaxID=2780090 RepID=UPI00187E1DC7|nr:aminotransferase class I/II-fold pyridoxal phosphate-dependent enzyme [Pedobacter sp. MC2016-24]MBE9599830.1 aminotransferase class I/II-fold pyridoxal phosphate-dependent enzyme [Pedobacter sp. MC2016-24]
MDLDFNKTTSKDFVNIPGYDAKARAKIFSKYLDHLKEKELLNYRLQSTTGCGPVMDLVTENGPLKGLVSFVSNDYLGFTQHPEIKLAVINAILKYGTGGGASPLIGGLHDYHANLESSIARFLGLSPENAISYTTGYTANTAMLFCLLQKQDLAIVDMAVHASVYEGCRGTNRKDFLHNNMEHLEKILKATNNNFRTRMIIVDGVYSQDGDIANLPTIIALAKKYGAMVAVDDAHGIGVVGKTGRGAAELYDLLEQIDLLTGTFSKAFGNIGGFVIASPELIRLLKYQSDQHIFSSTATPATAGIIRALDLIDEEPQWRKRLWENINYFKNGLQTLGLDIGSTQSAVIPIKIGDTLKTGEAGSLLLKAGIYANPIQFPAVSLKNARIRMSVMATHSKAQLDKALNAFEYVDRKLGISKQELKQHYEKQR